MQSKIIEKEKYSNCVKLTAKFKVGEKTHTERFGFSYGQINSGDWKGHIETWEENLKSREEINLSKI